jgi:Uncharacterized low-complexity proteins
MVDIPNDDDVSVSDIKENADLSDADLFDATLRKADLSDADLRRADLSSADLRRADLHRAELGGADVREAKMSSARVDGAQANYYEGEYITESHLSLMGAYVRSSDEPDD